MEDGRATILIIDDDPLMLSALTSILTSKYNVKAARSGEIGISMAQKHEIDMILLDVVMKSMSGYEVLEVLKSDERTKDIPVIFITGISVAGDEAKALSSGAVDYIRKPIIAEVVTLRVGLHLQLISQMRTIERFSLTDGLTGANNRRCFDQQTEAEWNRAARYGSWLSMMMLDIDHFKKFNDKYGHLSGDAALKTLANVLSDSVLRGADCVFRWGGEEFAVLLPDTPLEGAAVVAEKIRKTVETTPIICGDEVTYVTVSIGISSTQPVPGGYHQDAEVFYNIVDKALYKAKNSGRNKVVVSEN